MISARKSLEIDRLFVAQIDPVGGQRDIVIARAGCAQVGVDCLAGFTELLQIGADLFQLGPAGAQAFGLKHYSANVRIGGGFAQHHPEVGDSESGIAAAEDAGKFQRRLLGNVAREAKHQDRVIGDIRRLFAEAQQREEEQDEAKKNQENAGDQPEDKLDHRYSEGRVRFSLP
jgi:hypothetical protein